MREEKSSRYRWAGKIKSRRVARLGRGGDKAMKPASGRESLGEGGARWLATAL